MWKIRKLFGPLLAPAILLTLAYAVVDGVPSLMPDRGGLSGRVALLAPYVLAVPGIVFGLIYRHERIAYAAIALALGNLALANLWPTAPVAGASWTVGYAGLAVLLPGYLLYAALFSVERVFAIQGVLRLLVMAVIAQAVLMAVDGVLPPALATALDGLLHGRLFDRGFDSWSHLPQPAILLIILATVILSAVFLFKPGPIPAAFLGAMLATAGALDAVGDGPAPSLYLAAAQAMLLTALTHEAYGMAFLDELTGLPGRRALFADLGRLGSRYTLAMVDVDHFKKFNDTYGHDVGDQVLQMVASKLAAVGGGGASFRYGGEEFTVVFPGRDAAHSRPHLEDLRQAIASSSFRLRGRDRPDEAPHRGTATAPAGNRKRVGVTVSIGLAEGAGKKRPEEVLKASDEALYKAKKGGRNRVV